MAELLKQTSNIIIHDPYLCTITALLFVVNYSNIGVDFDTMAQMTQPPDSSKFLYFSFILPADVYYRLKEVYAFCGAIFVSIILFWFRMNLVGLTRSRHPAIALIIFYCFMISNKQKDYAGTCQSYRDYAHYGHTK